MASQTRDGLYRHGRFWWLRTDPVTKKRRSTRCRDRRAAEAYRAAREQEAASPRNTAAVAARLGEWCEKLLELKQRQCSGATVEVYEQKLGHWLRVLSPDFRLIEVTPTAVDKYVACRRSERVTDHTIVKELSALTQLLKLAKRSGCYPGDIAALKPLDLRAGYKPRKRALTPQELTALLSELVPARAAFVALAAYLGASLSEAFGLLPSDVDLEAGTVHLRGTKRPGRDRVVPILGSYRPLVECAVQFLPLAPWQNIRRDIAAACRRAGIAICTPNDLRRTHATMLEEAGVDRDVVRRLLGHTTTAMVDRIYAHPRPEALRELADTRLACKPAVQIRHNGPGPNIETGASSQDRTADLRFTKPRADLTHYQLYETTTEGTPISPVFETLDELYEWAAENASTFADYKATADEWRKMLSDGRVYAKETVANGKTLMFM